MRFFGIVLGMLFLADGLTALIGGQDVVRTITGRFNKRLPRRYARKMADAMKMNDTALTAFGINNVIAGGLLVLVAALAGLGRREVVVNA